MSLISIIVRTKNEERWIAHCLKMVYQQKFKDFEVILVDNDSTDHTVSVAERFDLKAVVSIREFKPGNALNEGIKRSNGKYIVCLSAHCVPKSQEWLSSLLINFEKYPMIAGVYGRQLPVSFTEAIDKRDLITVFGEDFRLQIKDCFFHNANSMIRRDVWERFPFDESVSNIEDRVWGKQVIAAGYKLAYDPEAAVYHHHGLHQGNTPVRAKGVVSIIEQLDTDLANDLPVTLRPENTNVAAIIPIANHLEDIQKVNELVASSVASLLKASYVNNIYIVSGTNHVVPIGTQWIDRQQIDNSEKMGLEELLKHVLHKIEEKKDYPEAILYVNYEYLDRPNDLFDELICDAQYKGLDTTFPGLVDYGHYWFLNDEKEFRQTDSSMRSRSHRQPTYRALYGLGCLTSATLIRKGTLVGGKIGIVPIAEERYTVRQRES